ncbi:hypothetical protein Bca101_078790 [Brassica carinata]
MFAPQVSVLPLQRPDEIHIPNPSWMQSPSPRATKFVSVPKFLLSNPQFFELIIEILLYFFFYCSMKIHLSDKMKVAFGGVDPVSQPPCQPDRSNEQTGTSNALALPGIVDKADKLDGGGGSKSGGSLASGTLGLEWRRSKLRCVTGRQRGWSN